MRLLVASLAFLLCFQNLNAQDDLFEDALDDTQTLEFRVHELQSPVLELGVEAAVGTSFQWYSGSTGVTANPIVSATSSTYTVPNGDIPGTFWARVIVAGSPTDSATFNLSFHKSFPDLPADGAMLRVEGSSGYGQLGLGEFHLSLSPIKIAENASKVVATATSSFYWTEDGKAWVVGSNSSGSKGICRSDLFDVYDPVHLPGIVDVFPLRYDLNLFLDEDGNLLAAGRDTSRYLEFSDFGYSTHYCPYRIADNVIDFQTNIVSKTSVVIKADGTAWAFGESTGLYGVYMNNGLNHIGNDIVSSRVASPYVLMLNTSNEVIGVGIVPGKGSVAATPEAPSIFAENIAEIVSVASSIILKTTDGKYIEYDSTIETFSEILYQPEASFGDFDRRYLVTEEGDFYKTRSDFATSSANPVEFNDTDFYFLDTDVMAFSAHNDVTLYIKEGGDLYASGLKSIFGVETVYTPGGLNTVDTHVKQVHFGSNSLFYIKTDDALWFSGGNPDSLVGDLPLYTISPVKLLDDVMDVSSNSRNTMILDTSGNVFASGINPYGTLGVGDALPRTEFTAVTNGSNVRAISNSTYSSLLIKNDNSLWAAGSGINIQQDPDVELGDYYTYTKIAENVVDAESGVSTFYLNESGVLFATGSFVTSLSYSGLENTHGVPYAVSEGVAQISVQTYSAAYIRWDGSLWVVGSLLSSLLNDYSYNSFEKFSVPVKIADDVAHVDITGQGVFYIKADGTNWYYGQKDGSVATHLVNEYYETPKEVFQNMNVFGMAVDGLNAGFLVTQINAPEILTQPEPVEYAVGDGLHSLTVETIGNNGSIQWYYGPKGDKSNPADYPNVLSITLLENEDALLWVELDNGHGVVQSNAVAVTITNPIYGAWIKSNGLNGFYSSPYYNFQDDAHNNLMEFIFNTDPYFADEVAIVGELNEANNTLVYTHSQSPSVDDFLSYTLSANLTDWGDLPDNSTVSYDAQTGMATIEIPTTGLQLPQFLKIGVTTSGVAIP